MNTKQLKAVYESRIKKALKKSNNAYLGDNYTFEKFKGHVVSFVKSAKKRDFVIQCKTSKSGMTRRFDVKSYSGKYNPNLVLNFIYNDKLSFEPVKVGGCGTDMLFHLFYTVFGTLGIKDISPKNNYRFIFFA